MIIGMVADETMSSVADITAPAWEAYCRKHKYEFVRWNPDGVSRPPLRRHPAWAKILLAKELSKSHYFVNIVDADSMPVNFEFEILKELRGPFGVAQDWDGACTSFMGFIADEWCMWFLDTVWNCGPILDDRGDDKWEQSTIKHLCKFKEIQKNVILNPLFHSDLKTYKPGDFLIHLPCLTNDERCRILQARSWERL